jgi:single-strand DNA-binding protein
MALSLNRVQLAGHLTRDPQVRVVNDKNTVAAFSIAINRRYKTADGENKEEATFVECEAWGRTAELVGQYLVKGSACYLEGRLRLDTWQDKDGQNRQRMKVVVEQVQFIGRPRTQGAAEDGADEETAPGAATAGATNARPVTPSTAPRRQTVGAAAGGEPPF